MKTKNLYILISLILLLAFSVSVQARPLGDTPLFVPDLTEAQFAEALVDSGDAADPLPELIPFWVDLVDAEAVSNNGSGVYVAVLDSGLVSEWPFLFSQADIASDLGKGFTHDIYWDDTLGGLALGPVRDDRGFITGLASGHGTSVTSTIVGFNHNSRWVQGVAPGATIIPVLVIDAWEVETPNGLLRISGGTDTMVAAAIRYVADLSETLDGPVVINMSFGAILYMPLVEDAINYAIAKGVILVASAGNNGTLGMGYPGGFPQVISAGAGGWADMFNQSWEADVPENLKSPDSLGNNSQHYLEDFSSRPNKYLGQKTQDLDVTAPGAYVFGPYRLAFSPDLGYYYLSGTSMAAPHVSAIASLVLESKPLLMQAEMEKILTLGASGQPFSADDAIVAYPFAEPFYYTATWGGGDYGAGLLCADAAFKAAKIE